MPRVVFTADVHGNVAHVRAAIRRAEADACDAVLLGGGASVLMRALRERSNEAGGSAGHWGDAATSSTPWSDPRRGLIHAAV